MKYYQTIIMLLLFLNIFNIKAQEEFHYFNKVFQADTMNIVGNIARSVEDGYFLIGKYQTLNNEVHYLLKTDEVGNLVWFKHLDEGEELAILETGRELILTDDGNYILAYEKVKPEGGGEIHVLKFTPEGEELNRYIYSDESSLSARQIVQTLDGGFALAGARYIDGDTTRYYILKIDDLGELEWEKTYVLDNHSSAFSIQQTWWDGGYIVSGMGYNEESSNDIYVIKIDSMGEMEWEKTYGGLFSDCAGYVLPLTTMEEYSESGGTTPFEYLLTGCIYQNNNEDLRMYIAKLDEDGEIIWGKKHNFLFNLSGFETIVIVKDNKSFIGVSNYNNSSYGQQNPVIIHFNADGSIKWHKTITVDEEQDVQIRDIQTTPDGGYILGGMVFSGLQKAWLLKIDSLGNTCEPHNCDSTVMINPPVFVGEHTSNNFHISPNPAQDYINIQIPIHWLSEQNFSLKINNINGKILKQITHKTNTKSSIYIDDLAKGIYFCTFTLPKTKEQIIQKLIIAR